MKVFCIALIITCFNLAGLAQDSKNKALEIINKSKIQAFKNTNSIEKMFVEASSRFSVRKDKLKPGIVPSYEYGTKLWIQTPNAIRLKTLIKYPDLSAQFNEKLLFDNQIKNSIKVKSPSDSGFVSIMFQERGDPKQNEQILLQKTKYEAFCLIFPIFLSSGEKLSFDYLGIAKAGDQSADVLATTFTENYKIKLYFDQKTHQLLLMNVKFVEPKTSEKTNQDYFFSDYKEENNVSFAHKVIIHENGEIIEERDIKAIQVNPKLETDFFEIKK